MSKTVKTKKKATKNTAAKKAAPKKTIKKAIKKAVPKKTAKKAAKRSRDSYLTKRILVKAAVTGFNQAAARTMRVMGENMIVKNGWIVRKLADGSIKRIARINNADALVLD